MQEPRRRARTCDAENRRQCKIQWPTDTVPVSAYWDLSTSHVAPADLDRLPASRLLAAYSYPEGAFVSLDPDLLREEGIDALTREGYSSAFVEVIRKALNANVSLIRFDADGPIYGGGGFS